LPPKSGQKRVRTLVINWWSYASDVTLLYSARMAATRVGTRQHSSKRSTQSSFTKNGTRMLWQLPNAASRTYSHPAPSSIGLYKEGQGYVKFEQAKADEYFAKVSQKVVKLITDTRRKRYGGVI
jgi:creatinine amidohydrolase